MLQMFICLKEEKQKTFPTQIPVRYRQTTLP